MFEKESASARIRSEWGGSGDVTAAGRCLTRGFLPRLPALPHFKTFQRCSTLCVSVVGWSEGSTSDTISWLNSAMGNWDSYGRARESEYNLDVSIFFHFLGFLLRLFSLRWFIYLTGSVIHRAWIWCIFSNFLEFSRIFSNFLEYSRILPNIVEFLIIITNLLRIITLIRIFWYQVVIKKGLNWWFRVLWCEL